MRARGLGSVSGRVAVVTGAANGIGCATASLLGERGALLALADRDGARLAELELSLRARGSRVLRCETDVTENDAVERFRDRVLAEYGRVELVVNAAGVVAVGGLLATEEADWDWLLGVNLKGPALVCRAFLPTMIASARGGQIVNVASASAFFTPRELVAYGASKHALVGLSQGLREELHEHGIGVSVICPGYVATSIVERARFLGTREPERERERARAALSSAGISAEAVARVVLRAAERGDELVPVGAVARVLRLLDRASPRASALAFRIGRKMLRT